MSMNRTATALVHGPRRSSVRRLARNQRGVSMLEVMISVLILGVGLLGIAAMQALARGQTSMTLAIATEPVAALQDRVNRIHLRMNLLGWKFVGQEFVSGGPGNSVLLLSYQR